MAAAVRRPAALAAVPAAVAAPVVTEGFMLGDLSQYTSGGGLPDGAYALFFGVQMYQAQNNQGVTKGPPRLGVMVDAYPLGDPDPAANVKHQFYSFGSKADQSWAPNATGKGIIPVVGGTGQGLNNQTNWALFLASLYDSGLPEGVFTSDFSTLDGIWVQTMQVPEPKERAGMQSNQSEVAEDRKPQKIAIITEIKEDGHPWERTGGMPAAVAKSAAARPAAPQAVARPVAAAAPRPAAPAAPVAAAPAEVAGDPADVESAAINGVANVLEKNPTGLLKMKLRTSTFEDITKSSGEETAAAVVETYFATDEALNTLLGQVGYKVSGPKIVLV